MEGYYGFTVVYTKGARGLLSQLKAEVLQSPGNMNIRTNSWHYGHRLC
ncbi:hypothetical protein V1498_18075 [Peribacillus sp. SCS-26]